MSETKIRQLLVAGVVSAALIAPALAGGTKLAALEPAKPGTLALGYSLSFWGISFGNTNYDGKFGADAYTANSHFKTSGIVSAFWQSEIDASANGRVDAHSLQPSLYDSYSRRSEEKKERVKMTFGAGAPVTFADPPWDSNKYPVSDEQKKEALDPMSAATSIFAGVTADASNPCGKAAPVFDGRRRYNIEFTYIKDEPVKLDNGVFSGTAHLCQIHYHQIAGFKPKMLKEGQSWPPIFGWFADVPSAAAPNGRYVVAVKVAAKTSWGTVTAQLTSLNVNGTSVGATKG